MPWDRTLNEDSDRGSHRNSDIIEISGLWKQLKTKTLDIASDKISNKIQGTTSDKTQGRASDITQGRISEMTRGRTIDMI